MFTAFKTICHWLFSTGHILLQLLTFRKKSLVFRIMAINFSVSFNSLNVLFILHEKRVESAHDFLFSVQQHNHRFIVLYTNLAAVTSSGNDLTAPDTVVTSRDNQLQKYLRHCTVFWLKWPVHDLVLVTSPPPLFKVASNTRPCSKLGGTTLNGGEEGGHYLSCLLYTSDAADEDEV